MKLNKTLMAYGEIAIVVALILLAMFYSQNLFGPLFFGFCVGAFYFFATKQNTIDWKKLIPLALGMYVFIVLFSFFQLSLLTEIQSDLLAGAMGQYLLLELRGLAIFGFMIYIGHKVARRYHQESLIEQQEAEQETIEVETQMQEDREVKEG